MVERRQTAVPPWVVTFAAVIVLVCFVGLILACTVALIRWMV